MTPSKFNNGYRCYGYTTHLCAVREGGQPPSQRPMSTLVKTSEIYVTYVTPVTGLKSLGLFSIFKYRCDDYPLLKPNYHPKIKFVKGHVMTNSFSIGPTSFRTRISAINYLTQLLKAGSFKSIISDPVHVEVLEALFFSRQSKIKELGERKIIGWCRSIQGTPCFAAMLDNGLRLNFSFHSSVDAIRSPSESFDHVEF